MRIGHHIRTALGRVRTFLSNRDANVAMMFAISLIPITIAAGAGLDLTRAMIVKSNLTEALDAAALAVGASSGLTQDQMRTVAQNYFNANYKADAAYGSPAAVTLTFGTQSVTAPSSVPMPTTLMNVAGVHTVNVTSTSTVVWGQTKLWVGLVLDNTGSMCQSDTDPNAGSPCANPASGTKIASLQTATHNLLTMLQNASANAGDVQVALVPFVKDVNVGTANAGATWIDWSTNFTRTAPAISRASTASRAAPARMARGRRFNRPAAPARFRASRRSRGAPARTAPGPRAPARSPARPRSRPAQARTAPGRPRIAATATTRPRRSVRTTSPRG